MSTDSFIITKRDGSTEAFSVEKIKSAILKAFTSVNEPLDNDGLQKIVGQLKFCNGMSVEDIQNQVEVALMSLKHFKAAKEFMIYRQAPLPHRLLQRCQPSNRFEVRLQRQRGEQKHRHAHR